MPNPPIASAEACGPTRAGGRRPRALLAMSSELADMLFDGRTLARLAELARLDPGLVVDDFGTAAALAALAETEVIVSSWGCPQLDARALAAAPRLRAVIHAAGTVKHIVTGACWERGIQVASAAWANALSVAEFTVAAILFANKRVLRLSGEYRRLRAPFDWQAGYRDIGNYGRTIGIVGASQIGRRVLELLRAYDFELLLHDPYVTPEEAERLGARWVELDDLCASSDLVSVHAPQLSSTRHLINRRRLALMRDGTTVVNTSRGSLIDQDALIEELVAGRLNASLDVTEPEVLPADSPLYDLPNVLLTPHVAGSMGRELHRMAAAAVDELARYTAGLPFAHPVREEDMHRMA